MTIVIILGVVSVIMLFINLRLRKVLEINSLKAKVDSLSVEDSINLSYLFVVSKYGKLLNSNVEINPSKVSLPKLLNIEQEVVIKLLCDFGKDATEFINNSMGNSKFKASVLRCRKAIFEIVFINSTGDCVCYNDSDTIKLTESLVNICEDLDKAMEDLPKRTDIVSLYENMIITLKTSI